MFRAYTYHNMVGAKPHLKEDCNNKAIADYSEAIRLKPSAEAYSERGAIFRFDKHDLASAFSDYSDAIRLKSTDVALNFSLYTSRAMVAESLKMFDQAVADYDEAKRISPKSFLRMWEVSRERAVRERSQQ